MAYRVVHCRCNYEIQVFIAYYSRETFYGFGTGNITVTVDLLLHNLPTLNGITDRTASTQQLTYVSRIHIVDIHILLRGNTVHEI